MQFQSKIDEFDNKGVAVIGISYDKASVLKNFADTYNITYPLLSDVGSRVIKAFGILNETVDPSSGGYGIPNPGLYVIDKNLTVLRKHFEKSYAARPSAETVLITAFGDSAHAAVRPFSTPWLDGEIALSDTTAYPAQVLTMNVRIKMRDGFHLYARPVPQGYTPFTITVTEDSNFAAADFQLPAGESFQVDGLEEKFFILPKEFETTALLGLAKKPQPGTLKIVVKMQMQACSEKACFAPEDVSVEMPIEVVKIF